jgi:hypothetical protein
VVCDSPLTETESAREFLAFFGDPEKAPRVAAVTPQFRESSYETNNLSFLDENRKFFESNSRGRVLTQIDRISKPKPRSLIETQVRTLKWQLLADGGRKNRPSPFGLNRLISS